MEGDGCQRDALRLGTGSKLVIRNFGAIVSGVLVNSCWGWVGEGYRRKKKKGERGGRWGVRRCDRT